MDGRSGVPSLELDSTWWNYVQHIRAAFIQLVGVLHSLQTYNDGFVHAFTGSYDVETQYGFT
ncbi:hypothetical protein A2U01_0043699 [Trifolium medium]|uniref:Uncharacterized protein n=1 Tax=Trifolium medium TaxID=97028 RepID=A0A392QDT4_9FABA|nr:hypothetical protein [Trifolium medium]